MTMKTVCHSMLTLVPAAVPVSPPTHRQQSVAPAIAMFVAKCHVSDEFHYHKPSSYTRLLAIAVLSICKQVAFLTAEYITSIIQQNAPLLAWLALMHHMPVPSDANRHCLVAAIVACGLSRVLSLR
jgi:hypothetical protein